MYNKLIRVILNDIIMNLTRFDFYAYMNIYTHIHIHF